MTSAGGASDASVPASPDGEPAGSATCSAGTLGGATPAVMMSLTDAGPALGGWLSLPCAVSSRGYALSIATSISSAATGASCASCALALGSPTSELLRKGGTCTIIPRPSRDFLDPEPGAPGLSFRDTMCRRSMKRLPRVAELRSLSALLFTKPSTSVTLSRRPDWVGGRPGPPTIDTSSAGCPLISSGPCPAGGRGTLDAGLSTPGAGPAPLLDPLCSRLLNTASAPGLWLPARRTREGSEPGGLPPALGCTLGAPEAARSLSSPLLVPSRVESAASKRLPPSVAAEGWGAAVAWAAAAAAAAAWMVPPMSWSNSSRSHTLRMHSTYVIGLRTAPWVCTACVGHDHQGLALARHGIAHPIILVRIWMSSGLNSSCKAWGSG